LAASTIGGVTLHKFLSIGLGKTSVDMLVKSIMQNTSAKLLWEQMKVLIIDEG
jgi:ATP-dependent DNA helicase PIF1